jgi:hypothetical protein
MFPSQLWSATLCTGDLRQSNPFIYKLNSFLQKCSQNKKEFPVTSYIINFNCFQRSNISPQTFKVCPNKTPNRTSVQNYSTNSKLLYLNTFLVINLCTNNSHVTKPVWEVHEKWVPSLLINIICKNCGKLIYIMEGKIHNKDMRKMTCCDAAHLTTDDTSNNDQFVRGRNMYNQTLACTLRHYSILFSAATQNPLRTQ